MKVALCIACLLLQSAYGTRKGSAKACTALSSSAEAVILVQSLYAALRPRLVENTHKAAPSRDPLVRQLTKLDDSFESTAPFELLSKDLEVNAVTGVAVLAVFKNEADVLQEWIDHYLSEGVDHVFLVDNNSTDNYSSVLQPYMSKGQVTLKIERRPHVQEIIYNQHLDVLQAYAWVLVVDLDEFVFSRLNFASIKSYLASVEPDIGQIKLPWKMFGSSGYLKQPSDVLTHFVKRQHYKHLAKTSPKSIIRPSCVSSFRIHSHVTKERPGRCRTVVHVNGADLQTLPHTPNLPSSATGLWKQHYGLRIDEDMLSTAPLHLNHYPIMSWERFKRVKMTRGDVSCECLDDIRDKDYFEQYDNSSNDLEDFLLAEKTRQRMNSAMLHDN